MNLSLGQRLAAVLAEWLICLPCLVVDKALPLFLSSSLLVLAARAGGRHWAFAMRLGSLARVMIGMTAAALFFFLATPWLLIPGAPLAEARLFVVLASVPLTQYPACLLMGIAVIRSVKAWRARPFVQATSSCKNGGRALEA